MASSPVRQEGKAASTAGRFVAIGAPVFVIGLVMALLLDHTALGIGVALAVLGAIPIVVGLVLMTGAGVHRRARHGKPFA
jgi:hypothetical protein